MFWRNTDEIFKSLPNVFGNRQQTEDKLTKVINRFTRSHINENSNNTKMEGKDTEVNIIYPEEYRDAGKKKLSQHNIDKPIREPETNRHMQKHENLTSARFG